MNYLSKQLNSSLLFDIYNINYGSQLKNNEKHNENEPESALEFNVETNLDKLDDLVFNNNQIEADIDFYNECYDKKHRRFNKDLLIKHMDTKFPYICNDFKFDYVPIYCYVSKTGKLSRTATQLTHLAVIFNV